LLVWLGVARGLIDPAWVIFPIAIFLVLLVVHALVLNAKERGERARRYYLRGVARLDGSWPGTGPDGARFSEGHPYARDLDLFGPGSLFQLLDTARTEIGEDTLADWLREGATIEEIGARQAAVGELRDRLEFRETLATRTADVRVSRTGTLARWAASAREGFLAWHAMLFAAFAVAASALAVALFADLVPLGIVLLWLAVQSAVVSIWRARVARVIRGVDAATYDLGLLSELLACIERESFTSPRLRALHETLVSGGLLPSQKIATLKRYIAARDSMRFPIVKPFAMLLVVKTQAAVAIDRWHARYAADLARWLSVVGEIEALASLATYAYERPRDPFPRLSDAGPAFVAGDLAHPLIPNGVAICNDVELGGQSPRVLIVSGSNMSGKSTLLRAIGTNAVLAMAGAPVRASALTLSPMTIGSTIRVEDSLQDGYSRFYAEILRIRDIVAAARGRRPVLFLLDEILGGTNSHDRRIGAAAVVKALVEAGAIGAVTTHDLALTDLAGELGARARNVHFEDRVADGKMVFDYLMRDGVVTRSNALELMRSVGLDV